MRIGVNLLTHVPAGQHGPLLTSATAMAVRSLAESDIMEHDVRLVVVDNLSDHNVYREWQAALAGSGKIEHLKFVSTGRSLSFAEARNVGYQAMHYAHSSWDLFLEFDVDNVFPGVWFAPLLKSLAAHPEAGVFSPGTIMASHWHPTREPAIDIDYAEMHYSQVRYAVDQKAAECRRLYKGRVGSVRHPPVLYRAACLREIGLYDPNFVGGGWEDWDQVMRVEATDQWQVCTFLSSFVFHWTRWEGSILGGWQHRSSESDDVANRRYFFAKWPGAPEVYRAYLGERDRLYYLSPEEQRG